MLKIKDPDHLRILMTVFFDAKFSPEYFNWEKLSLEERRTHIEQHITPFSFDEELIDRLVAFGDSLLAERTDS